MRHLVQSIVLVAALAPSAVHAQSTDGSAACYRLTYHDQNWNRLYATYIATYPEHYVRSGMDPGKKGSFWRMFLTDAKWAYHVDTLELDFTNGFSGVRLKLLPIAGTDSVAGQVFFDYDVIDERPPPSGVAGSRIHCSDAHLQSPRVTTADSQLGRALAHRDSLVERESARIRSLVSPLAGTYVFSVFAPDARPITVFGRSSSAPAGPLWSLEPESGFGEPVCENECHAAGYRLSMVVSLDSMARPRRNIATDQAGAAIAVLDAGERAVIANSDSTVWTGDTDVLFALSRLLPGQPNRAVAQAVRAVNDVWYRHTMGRTDGRWVLHADGVVSFDMRVYRDGKPVITVTGWRVSRDVLKNVTIH